MSTLGDFAHLNALRLPANQTLSSQFTVTLLSISGGVDCAPTSADGMGPFHLPPEDAPTQFPERQEACVPYPSCPSCATASEVPHFGLPLHLVGHVRSSTGCAPILGPQVSVDVWQADADGKYWDEDGLWPNGHGRRLQTHLYQCRAHLSGGNFSFSSILPGHYLAASSWRPRHIHMRVRAPGHRTLVTQVYFRGDPAGGDAESCEGCAADKADLIVPLELASSSTPGEGRQWSLSDLTTSATAESRYCNGACAAEFELCVRHGPGYEGCRAEHVSGGGPLANVCAAGCTYTAGMIAMANDRSPVLVPSEVPLPPSAVPQAAALVVQPGGSVRVDVSATLRVQVPGGG